MKLLSLLLCCGMVSGCASYVVPGGPVQLESINRADIAEIASRRPAATFPARLAIVRVQAPAYRSYTADSFGSGSFAVLTTQELLTDAHFGDVERWSGVSAIAPVGRLLLPARLESIDDLRLAAAKLQADILIVYTIDTSFRVQGRSYGPLSVISLGIAPDRDAYVTSTASVVFTDVRTGYTYGVAESTARTSGLTNVWGSRETIDRKRVEAESDAFNKVLIEAKRSWEGIIASATTAPGN